MNKKEKNKQLPILIALIGILFIVGGIQLHRFTDHTVDENDPNYDEEYNNEGQIDLVMLNCNRQIESDGIRDDELTFFFEEGLLNRFSETNTFNTTSEEARLLFQLEMEERNNRFLGMSGYASMSDTEGNITSVNTHYELSILDLDQIENASEFVWASAGQTMDEVRDILLSNGFSCE